MKKRPRIYQFYPDPTDPKKNDDIIKSLTGDEKSVLFKVMVDAAASVGTDGAGQGGLHGYLQSAFPLITDEDLKSFAERFPDAGVRSLALDEMEWRAKKRRNKVN